MHIPLENLIPSHANCMQHVLRCWERQSDGTEYKKTLAAGAPPRTPLGSLQRSHKPTIWWKGLAAPLPKNPSPLGPSGLACPTPTPKLVPTRCPKVKCPKRMGRLVDDVASAEGIICNPRRMFDVSVCF